MKKALISTICILLCFLLCSCSVKENYTEKPTETSPPNEVTDDSSNDFDVLPIPNTHVLYSSSYGENLPHDDIKKFVYAVSQGEEYYNEYANSKDYKNIDLKKKGILSYEKALSVANNISSVPWIFVKEGVDCYFAHVAYNINLDDLGKECFEFAFIVDDSTYDFTYYFGKSIEDSFMVDKRDIIWSNVTMGSHKFNLYKHARYDYVGHFLEGDPLGTLSIVAGLNGLPYDLDIFEFKNFSEIYSSEDNELLTETSQ